MPFLKKYTNKLIGLVFVCLAFFCLGSTSVVAQSSGLESVTDIIDFETLNTTNVNHQVSFKLPINSLAIETTDYVQINLQNFSSVTAATGITGQYSGTPVFTVDSGIVKITGIFVLPGETLTFTGITATNPGSPSQFGVTVSVTQNQAGTIIKNFGSTTASSNPGTVTVTAEVTVPQATIRISGFTAPTTFVSFIEGENVIGTDLAGQLGIFSKVFTAMEPGTYSISLYGIDEDSRATSIVPLTINAPAYQTTTVSNLLLSPTIEINSTSIPQGAPIYATGSAYPGTSITLFTDTPLRTYNASTSASGDWTTTISDTASYNPGDYRLYTLAQSGGLQSLTSRTIVFSITSASSSSSGTACGNISQGDLNCDSDIDLTDFSILMFYWATTNATADINSDGVVNLTDFSILMYYWGSI